MRLILFLVILATISPITHSARILLTGPQIYSHMATLLSIGEELARRGHEVYIAVASRFSWDDVIERAGVRPLTFYAPADEPFGLTTDGMQRKIAEWVFDSESREAAALSEVKLISGFVYHDCERMLSDTAFMGRLKEIGFSLALVNPFVLMPCNVILPNVIGIPYASIGFFLPWIVRIPALPSFYSFKVTSPPSTFVYSVLNTVAIVLFDKMISSRHNRTLIDRFASNFSSYDELVRKSELFLNVNDLHFDCLLPTFPNIISVPGCTVKPSSPLPDDLDRIFNESGDGGIILASFGSIAHYMLVDIIEKFLDAFSRLNSTVVAKFGIPDGVDVPPNVHLMSWLPQNDILGHPKTRLFITHCGNNGQHEALYHGVPMLGFPLFAEQAKNCHRAFLKGYGLMMDIHSFSVADLERNIRKIIDNATYRTTIERASAAWRDEPMIGREKAAFWIDHVIKYGGAHLRSVAMDMPLYRLLMLDVLFVALGVFVIFVCVVVYLARFLIRNCYKMPRHG